MSAFSELQTWKLAQKICVISLHLSLELTPVTTSSVKHISKSIRPRPNGIATSHEKAVHSTHNSNIRILIYKGVHPIAMCNTSKMLAVPSKK